MSIKEPSPDCVVRNRPLIVLYVEPANRRLLFYIHLTLTKVLLVQCEACQCEYGHYEQETRTSRIF